MEFQNKFIKGAITDLEYLNRDGSVWTFPSKNIRIFNYEGQGLIVSALPGTEQFFKISTRFVVLGAAEYNGIIYIVSRRPGSDGGNAECEIGCYPSPSSWDEDNRTFDETFDTGYKPLHNYKSTSESVDILDMRTELFMFPEKRLEVVVRPDYDDTVNIYISDNENPNIVVNSGFKQNGAWVGADRNYNPESFKGSISHIPHVNDFDNIDIMEWETVEGGGRLRPGTYYVFIRYVTKEYARTKFISYCGPIPIADGNDMINTQGLQDKNIINNTEPFTVKKIELSVNIDGPDYKYFELAIIRYSSDYDYGLAKPNAYLISQQYPIDTTTVVITGLEAQEIITEEEIMAQPLKYNICKTQLQVRDTWMGANWKRKEINYEALAAYALKITATGKLSEEEFIYDPRLADLEFGSYADLAGYKKPLNYKKVGYFRGEIYPFSIVYEFDDNTESMAYPITGVINGVTNTKGLVKMPGWQTGTIGKAMCVEFDTQYAVLEMLTPNGAYSIDDFAHVIGFRFVRGERIDNLICQGYTLPCYDHFNQYHSNLPNEVEEAGFNFSSENEGYEAGIAYSIPLIEGLFPICMYDINNTGNDGAEYYHYAASVDHDGILYANVNSEEPEYFHYYIGSGSYRYAKTMRYNRINENNEIKFGLFSPDINFTENPSISNDIYIKLIRRGFPYYGDIANKHSFYSTDDINYPETSIRPKFIGMDLQHTDGSENHSSVDATYSKAKRIAATFIEAFTQKGDDMFTSWMPAEAAKHSRDVGDEIQDIIYNRSYRTSRYIGITDNSNWPTGGKIFDYKYYIANLYKQDPEDLEASIVSSYTVFASEYKPLDNLLVSVLTGIRTQRWGGDCFLQKSWIRVGRYYGFDKPGVRDIADDLKRGIDGEGYVDEENNYYQWGIFLGVITENKYNVELRNEVYTRNEQGSPQTYTYLPRAITRHINTKNWVVYKEIAAIEGMQINDGYNKTLPDKRYYGYDPNRDYGREVSQPNRIYVSDKYSSGSIVDSYRIIGSGSFKDYNISGGPIMRMVNIEDFICVIQKHNIIQIGLQEKAIETDSPSVRLTLATSKEFLSNDFKTLAEYGSQHQFAIHATDRVVYGIDYLRKLLWIISPQRGSTGSVYLQSDDMGLKYSIKKHLEETFEEYAVSDTINGLDDDTVNNTGCFIGYDKKFKEVLFCFAKDNAFTVIVFSEILQAFTCQYTYKTNMFFNLGDEKLLSVGLDYQGDYEPTNYIYRHNVGSPLMFYGEKQELVLSFVVTGLTEDQNVSTFKKIFEALAIDMSPEQLKTIVYETQTQISTYTFSVDSQESWKDAEHSENTWKVPVYIQTSEDNGDQYEDSEMRGRWMKVTLTYYPNGEPQGIFIRSVITKFTLSLS